MSLGETLYRLRAEKNLSQGDLAEKLDVSRQSISKWENNSAVPDLEKIVKLSEIFDVSLDVLVKGEEAPKFGENAIPESALPNRKRNRTLRTYRDFVVLISVFIIAILLLIGQRMLPLSSGDLYQQGLDVISLMVEAARCEGYVELNTGDHAVRESIQDIGSGNFTMPKAVYAVTVTDEVLWDCADWDDYEIASDALREAMKDKMLPALLTQFNAMSSVEKLVASSVCAMNKTFFNKNVTENVIYIYIYDNAMPVAVSFIVGEGGAISAKGNFIMYNEVAYRSVEDIKACFNGLDVEVEQIK